MNQSNVSEILKSITLLSKSFSSFFENEMIAKEVAFHLADIEPELMEIYDLLQYIKKTGKVNAKQAGKVFQSIIHWNYHGAEIQKLLEGERANSEDRS